MKTTPAVIPVLAVAISMRRGWTKAELKRRRKGDEAKVALARRLREETAVSL